MSRKKPSKKRKQSIQTGTLELNLSQNPEFSLGLLIAFVVCSFSLFAFSIWLPESTFDWLNENTAWMAARCLSVVGMHPVLHGRTLSQDGFSVSVITECSSLYMAILFFSFVVAYPATLRQKLIGLPVGIAVLHAGNILRIAALFAIGVRSSSSFELVHVYFGQVLMVLFVPVVCLAWLNIRSEPPAKHELLTFLVRFFAFTGILFLLWLPLNKEYVKLADYVVIGLFSHFGYRFAMKYQHVMYYQTFNVVTFTGLVLATRTQALRRKFQMLAAGHVTIFVLHILFRVCNVLLAYFHNEPAVRTGAGITVCGQYILPVGLWLIMVRNAKTAKNNHAIQNKDENYRVLWVCKRQREAAIRHSDAAECPREI